VVHGGIISCGDITPLSSCVIGARWMALWFGGVGGLGGGCRHVPLAGLECDVTGIENCRWQEV
jgi:hypothetical protein